MDIIDYGMIEIQIFSHLKYLLKWNGALRFMTNLFIPFDEKTLVYSQFIDRPNRFIIRCKLENTNEIVEAHLADSGRLKELLQPNKKVILRSVNDPKRKTKFSAVAVEQEKNTGWVSINSSLPNELAKRAVKNNLFPQLKNWQYLRSEYPKGNSRWDMLLQKDEKHMVVEVKGVSLASEAGIGYFPDAVTKRGTKHLKELSQIMDEETWRSALIFVAQREDVHEVMPATHIDPAFAEALKEAKEAGVLILGLRCRVTPKGITILDQIKVTI